MESISATHNVIQLQVELDPVQLQLITERVVDNTLARLGITGEQARRRAVAEAERLLAQQVAIEAQANLATCPLTVRELEILHHIRDGGQNKEIARTLKISDQTVKNHITSILRKLNVADRTQAVVYALRMSWILVSD